MKCSQLFIFEMTKAIHYILSLFFIVQLNGQETTMGLFLNTEDAYDGYTLLSNNEFSYLIDNCGYQVNSWESNYKAGLGLYITDEGNLLRAGKINGNFSAGGRGGVFQLFDWDGNLEWEYRIANNTFHAHHDLALLPNGNFLCIVWEKKTQSEAEAVGWKYETPLWSENIWEIEILPNNEANIIWQWSVWDHLVQDHNSSLENYDAINNHPELIDVNYIGDIESTQGDRLHFNGISYNESLDQIAISSRNLSEIYIIDHSTSTAQSETHEGGIYNKGGDILYRYGNPQVYDNGTEDDQILFNQHHIDWVESGSWQGNFSVFNNEYIPNTRSEALIWNNPADSDGNYHYDLESGYGNEAIIHNYTESGFYSSILSSVQVLPNDNLLLLEGKSGVLTEIKSNYEVVWSYIYPVNANGGPGIQSGTPMFNSLYKAIRYSRNFIGFDDKDLTPTYPIELSPNDYECDINLVSNNNIEQKKPFTVVTNPVTDQIWIESLVGTITNGYLIDIIGQQIKNISIQPGIHSYAVDHLTKGTYVLMVNNFSKLIIVN